MSPHANLAAPQERRPTTVVEVPAELVAPLRKEGARRDVSLQRLVSRLLEVAVNDQLWAAILDDEPTS